MRSISITLALALACAALASTVALADTPAVKDQQRNVNQQTRIEQGLKSGELSTHEAARLEREQQHVDRMEAHALKDGHMSAGEQLRLDKAQDAASKDIYKQKHDVQEGNPNSASSQRMQASVQRNVNQQQRIQNGMDNGSLTNREASRLEAGQARIQRKQANAGADGHVGAAEQHRIRRTENRQSHNVFAKKHNARAK
jgi:hypothetical protein